MMDLVERATYLRIQHELHCESTRGSFIEDCEPPEVGPGALKWVANTFLRFRDPANVSDCVAVRVHDLPWFIVVWEPLNTTAPSPETSRAHCCYMQTVIFYHKPHTVDGDTGSLKKWDEIEHDLIHDDVLEFEDERFRVERATCVWRQGRWWMRYRAGGQRPK